MKSSDPSTILSSDFHPHGPHSTKSPGKQLEVLMFPSMSTTAGLTAYPADHIAERPGQDTAGVGSRRPEVAAAVP